MKKIVVTMIFVIITLLLSYTCSYAAVLESKDSNSTVVTGGTISDFYVMAEGMKGTGQGLEGTTVDVKMANNYEWALVSYFSNSAYGTGGTGGNTGIRPQGSTHLSTNGNVTGVMDWGRKYTYTAGIILNYATATLTTEGNLTLNQTVNSVLNAAGTGNRIDKFPSSNYNEDIAQTKWYSAMGYCSSSQNHPYSIRSGLFGFHGGYGVASNHGAGFRTSGAKDSDVTFRSVFYAQ